jgi:hypothetical protein
MTFRHLLPIVVVASLCAGGIACTVSSKGTTDRIVRTRGAPGEFRQKGVGTVFEKRCGSLDCHGNIGRNMRIYSTNGLRLPNDAGLTPGNGDTTLDESNANYLSIMTLEPEDTNAVLEGGDPYSLQILKKPLEIEKHKGGPVIRRGDDAESCISSWLLFDPEHPIQEDACRRAAIFPKE